MKTNKKWKAKTIEVAVKTAVLANGAASWWQTFQPKEPEEMKKLCNKM